MNVTRLDNLPEPTPDGYDLLPYIKSRLFKRKST